MGGEIKRRVVSANLLLEGDVVYRDAAGAWSLDLAEAAIAETPEAAETLLSAAASEAHLVVDAALIEVVLGADGAPTPATLRERIRAAGPTTRLDLGKQAERGFAARSAEAA